MSIWPALEACRRRGHAAVIVTIASVEGSAPRGVGTRMLVTRDAQVGTIGGGALERAGIEHARSLLAEGVPEPRLETRSFNLSRALSQCCGGVVELHFERVPPDTLDVQLFGAGHVGQEVVRLMQRLPCRLTVHDPRPEWLARLPLSRDRDAVDLDLDLGEPALRDTPMGSVVSRRLPDNVHAVVEAGRPSACWLVMTHDHALDLEIVEAVLARGDATFCGLIASRSKAVAFRSRLARKGFQPDEIAGLTAPLGERTLTGNTPMEVAIAAASDLLSAHRRR